MLPATRMDVQEKVKWLSTSLLYAQIPELGLDPAKTNAVFRVFGDIP
jgi:hypothetical protein